MTQFECYRCSVTPFLVLSAVSLHDKPRLHTNDARTAKNIESLNLGGVVPNKTEEAEDVCFIAAENFDVGVMFSAAQNFGSRSPESARTLPEIPGGTQTSSSCCNVISSYFLDLCFHCFDCCCPVSYLTPLRQMRPSRNVFANLSGSGFGVSFLFWLYQEQNFSCSRDHLHVHEEI